MRRRLFGLPWRSERAIREDVDEELRFHLDARAADLSAEGVDPEEARAQALREFGDIEDARRYIRRMDREAEAEKRRRVHKKSAPTRVGARKGSRWSGWDGVLIQAW